MPLYSLASKELLDSIKGYIQQGEVVNVSEILECNNVLYKEVLFTKKVFKNLNKQHLGYLFMDDKNEIVTEKSLQEKLSKLAYFSEIFYNTENRSCIVNAFQDKTSVQKDIEDDKLVIQGLDYLTCDGINDIEKVKQIVIKLPAVRNKNNDAITRLMDITNENKGLNDIRLEELLPTYREALSINLQKIRIVYSQKDCYTNIKVVADQKRKQIAIRFNPKLSKQLKKISYIMDYFIKLVNTCEKISKMSDAKYFKYLDSIEKENINFRVKLNRSKKNS